MDFTHFTTIRGGFKLVAEGPGGCEFRVHHGQRQLRVWGGMRVEVLTGRPKKRERRKGNKRFGEEN